MKHAQLDIIDLSNLKDLFNENYLLIKQIKEMEKQSKNIEEQKLLKEIRKIHNNNLILIMKTIDTKERIL